MSDERWMKRALALARKGRGRVHPNPLVGALVLRQERIVGSGFHHAFGEAHAEVNAIHEAGSLAQGATLVVNLEPCCFHGKTPACTDLILKSGIKRVVIGMQDPHMRVHGRSIQILKNAGLDLKVGVLEPLCRELNAPFIKYVEKGESHVTLKMAQTLDGRIASADGSSRWITGMPSRTTVHKMRSEHDAILVGVNTVIRDNPSLTVRHVRPHTVNRIILDGEGKTTSDCRVLYQPGDTVIAVSENADADRCRNLEKKGATVWRFPAEKNRIDIHEILKKCAERGWLSLMVEGGTDVFTQFIKAGASDKVVVFIAPRWMGQGLPVIDMPGIENPNEALAFRIHQWRRRGDDIMLTGWM